MIKIISEHYIKNPNGICIILDNGLQISYKMLFESSKQIARGLLNFGLSNKSAIGIFCNESYDTIKIILGCWLINATPVLLHPFKNISDINKQIRSSNLDCLIIDKNFNSQSKIIVPVYFLNSFDLGFFKHSLVYHKKETKGIILFTSGTTGIPKAVHLSEYNLIQSAKLWNENLKFNQEDIYLSCMPIYHIGGVSIFFRSIIFGFKSIQLNKFDVNLILSFFQNQKITFLSLVPTMLNRISVLFDKKKFKYLRGFIVSGGSSSEKLIKYCLENDIPVFKSYGMTETSSGICGFWINQYQTKLNSVGLLFRGNKIKFENSRILLNGPTIMSGYINDSPTKGWFTTDDYGSIDEDGFIYLQNRLLNRIISGGENINLHEVEMVIRKHPQIHYVKAFGETDEYWGQILVAEVISDIDREDIVKWLRNRILKYKIPKKFYFIKLKK